MRNQTIQENKQWIFDYVETSLYIFSIIQFDFPIISEHLLKLQDMNHAFAKLCLQIYLLFKVKVNLP